MKEKLKRLIGKSEFAINVSKLFSASAIAQVVSLISAPVLYRIYSKEEYGILGIYMATIGVIGVFSTFQYTHLIMVEKNEEEALVALRLNRLINIALMCVCVLVVLMLKGPLSASIGVGVLNNWVYLIPVSFFFSGQTEILKVWANRKKEYNLITLVNVTTSLLIPTCSIGFSFVYEDETGLIIGLLVSHIVPAVILWVKMSRKYPVKHMSLSEIRRVIIPYALINKSFPMFTLPSEFVNRFTSQLPVFMLNHYSGVATVGVYNLAVRMLGLPAQFIGGAVSTVYQQRASSDYNTSGTCKPIFVKTVRTLAGIAIIPAILLMIFAPDLFSWFFGAEWVTAGQYARILLPLYAIQFVVVPVSYIYFIRKKLKEDFVLHVGILITILGAYFIGLNWVDAKFALKLHVIGYSFWYLVYLVRSYKYS